MLAPRRLRLSRHRGQELVEFAVVLPLLLLVIIGVLDLGRVFFAAIAVANVAREGARFGVDFDWSQACAPACGYLAVEDAALDEARNSSVDMTMLYVVANCFDPGCARDTPLVVTANYDFELILESILPDFTIRRTTTMMIP